MGYQQVINFSKVPNEAENIGILQETSKYIYIYIYIYY